MVQVNQRLLKTFASRRKGVRNAPEAILPEALENRRLLSGYVLSNVASFNGVDGQHPLGALIMDSAGNLYGTTTDGGADGSGSVFEIVKGSGSITTLASFSAAGAQVPIGTLLIDSQGNLYGIAGGNDGSVYEVVNGSGVITTLAAFDLNTGQLPSGGLAMDSAGDLFGTTEEGGVFDLGTIYEVAAGSDAIATLASFNGTNGRDPAGGVIMDSAGNLYGTTALGGGTNGTGTIFELAGGSTVITKLATFQGLDGSRPQGALIMDAQGNLYGTAHSGGPVMIGSTPLLLGDVFELARGSGAITVLGAFNLTDGQNPTGTLAMDSSGDLFGITPVGGANGFGTAFEITRGSDTITTIANLDGTNGSNPFGGLVIDSSGDLLGTASGGGASHDGAVFELSPNPVVQLAFTALPTTSSLDAPVMPPISVSVEDASGNVVTTDDSTVTLSIASGPFGAALLGNVSVAAVDGVATFNGLSLNRPGTYTLAATDGTLATVASANGTFAIIPNPLIPAMTSASFPVPSNAGPSAVAASFGRVVLPASVVAGATFNSRAQVSLTNTGGTLRGVYTVNLFLSAGGSLNGDQALVATGARRMALGAGRRAVFNFNLKPLPLTQPGGSYSLLAQVIDPAGGTALITASQTISVAAPVVNLGVSAGAVVPSTLNADLAGSLPVTIVNNGNINATGLLDVTLSPSSDGVSPIPGETLAVLVFRIAPILPGKSRTFTLTFKPTTLPGGTYFCYLSVSVGESTATAVGPQFTVG